jgi:hypothetical protein
MLKSLHHVRRCVMKPSNGKRCHVKCGPANTIEPQPLDSTVLHAPLSNMGGARLI